MKGKLILSVVLLGSGLLLWQFVGQRKTHQKDSVVGTSSSDRASPNSDGFVVIADSAREAGAGPVPIWRQWTSTDACEHEYTPERILATFSDDSPPGDYEYFLRLYFICRALETRQASVCEQKWPVPPDRADLSDSGDVRYCKNTYFEHLAWLAMVRKDYDQALEMCMRGGINERDFIKGAKRELCRITVRLKESAQFKEVCDRVQHLLIPGKAGAKKFLRDCEKTKYSSFPWGGSGDCIGGKTDIHGVPFDECKVKVAVRRATEQSDPSLCGDSDLCAAVVRSPQACAGLARKTTKDFCEVSGKHYLAAMTGMENDFRKQAGLPNYKPGDKFIHALPEERKLYELAVPENIFRQAYGLPAHKPGMPFLHVLPPDERRQYERTNLDLRKSESSEKDQAPENAGKAP